MVRVLGRVGRCVLTYVLLHTVTWVVIAAAVPWPDSFAEIMSAGFGMLAVIGIPTLLLAVIAGLAHRNMAVTHFRTALAFPMAFFALPLAGASIAEPLILQFVAQIAFAAFLMPAPLIPENWEKRAP